ncbi:fimbria/pilus periplasmic chaperone [Escherichia coli]|uniref:fimbria/pilus periplasmic chaperone n=1 Tax=Escherichia coli TaxID=562 RepID=UPI0013D78A0F|nr:fimbria/pilus periplasmic chaperone [Escherichia coli]EFP0205901.1 fimbria/pilus periplasmic chaperone [Escherichia coli]EIQ0381036.1 fimbria/pilus periplasmic chaperone [Escherichia coli]MCN2340877.1 fimbria/pilus periplasmic chaperone [Escherichia coli]MCN7778307.1 fimbria/pilus periplasmic chaperone [Escherichia coli]
MLLNKKNIVALCVASSMAFSMPVMADIVISGTRVIYKSDQKSVSVRLENKGNSHLLVQSWLDTGSTVLPSDKESVFWFNVLEVPPKPDASKVENQSLLQLAFRTRIKLFYRPAGLNGNPSEAPLALKWKWAEGKSGLSVYNPTSYYVSFNSAELIAGGKSNPLNVKMVAPKSEEIFTISGSGGKATSGKVHFSAINDFGGAIEGDVNL